MLSRIRWLGLGLALPLLLGAIWVGKDVLQPSAAGVGEVGDVALPFGAGVFVQVDAGTVNAQALNVGGVVVDTSPDLFIQFDDPVTVVTNLSDFDTWGPTQHALTLKNCTCSVPTPGGGTGTETWKATSGAGGTGTTFITVVVPCNAIAGNTCTSCTITTAAVPANTTFHQAVTAACGTLDVTSRIKISATEP